MKVAVIGTGNVGHALGTSLVRAGHGVVFASQDPARSRALAVELGAASAGVRDAARDAEVVVLAVPYASLDAVAATIGAAADGKVVIDATNPLRPDYSGLALASGSAAEQLAEQLPGARVVKAFNTLFATIQGDPAIHGMKLDGLFAANDDAKATTAELIASIGLRPIHVGPLSAAHELEALAWLNIRLQLLSGGNWQSSYVLVGAPPASIAA